MTVIWTEEMSVGDATIDRQHQNFIDKLNAFTKKKNFNMKQLIEMVDFLKEHALIHFEYEERYMQAHDFPKLQEHKKLHVDFTEAVYQQESKIASEGIASTVELLKKILEDWLVDHVLHADQEYEAHINAHPDCHPPQEAADYHTTLHE